MKSNQAFRSVKTNDEANIHAALFGVIGAVLVLVVGLSLTTTVVSFVNSSFAALTGNTASQNLVNIIPVFYILGLVAASIALVFIGLRYGEN